MCLTLSVSLACSSAQFRRRLAECTCNFSISDRSIAAARLQPTLLDRERSQLLHAVWLLPQLVQPLQVSLRLHRSHLAREQHRECLYLAGTTKMRPCMGWKRRAIQWRNSASNYGHSSAASRETWRQHDGCNAFPASPLDLRTSQAEKHIFKAALLLACSLALSLDLASKLLCQSPFGNPALAHKTFADHQMLLHK